jgi:hypothetical protein
VRSASDAPTCCLKLIVTGSFETGPVHDDFEKATSSDDASEKAPFVSRPGSEPLYVASPALDTTVADVDAV